MGNKSVCRIMFAIINSRKAYKYILKRKMRFGSDTPLRIKRKEN